MDNRNRCFSRELTLGYNHAFQDGRISMTALMEELEETAGEHCRVIGQDIFSLLERESAWILKGGALEVDRYPRYAEKVRIETWISSLARYRGYREFHLRDRKDRLLGRASTLWVFMDLRRRTLRPIPQVFHERWPSRPLRGIPTGFKKQEYPPLEEGRRETFALRRRDFDSNRHVHNIRYLEWIAEAVPPEIYQSCQVRRMEVLYRKEARSDNPIQIRTLSLGERRFRHDIRDAVEGTLLLSARSQWEEKSLLYAAERESPVLRCF